jgi:hypothetical protein
VLPDTTLEQAFATIAAHQPDPDGRCQVCAADPDIFVISPCVISREALAVIETHGVRHWDTPESPLPQLRDGMPRRGHLPRGV